MLIRQIPIHDNLRNYMYLLACDQTLEAIAIDPLDHALSLEVAKELDLGSLHFCCKEICKQANQTK